MSSHKQDKSSETEFWDRIAQQRIYAAFDEEEYEDVFNRVMPDLYGKKVLDIGSASGISCALLAKRGAQVIGVDISSDLIKQANELWKDWKEHIAFMVGDAENLDIVSGTVDYCFFGGVLHHFPDRSGVYCESLRVLKDGGRFIAVEPSSRDVLELLEWKIAGWRKKLSPNEYPIDPMAMHDELERIGYEQVNFYNIRHDIPFLAQLPILIHFFSRKKGNRVKKPILSIINRFRPSINCGTFFVITGNKPLGAGA